MKLFLPILALILFSCKAKAPTESGSTSNEVVKEVYDPCSQPLNQGITGNITFLEGNVMPGSEDPLPKGKPVEREVWIFDPLQRTKVPSDEGVFFFADTSNAVARQLSGEDGCYSIPLQPGLYSVLVFEPEKGLFANIFNRTDLIQSVMVDQGKVSKLNIEINYKAAY